MEVWWNQEHQPGLQDSGIYGKDARPMEARVEQTRAVINYNPGLSNELGSDMEGWSRKKQQSSLLYPETTFSLTFKDS